MISEEILKKAAAEADQAIRDSLPAPKECRPEFSTAFQKRMSRIVRRAKHPVLYKLSRYAACFILAAILVSSTLLTFNTEVRAAFFAWVREQYESFIEYKFTGDVSEQTEAVKYVMTWIPEGYEEAEAHTPEGSSITIYKAGSERMIQFMYSQGQDASSLFVFSDASRITSIELGHTTADFYEDEDKSAANALVWAAEDGNTMFCITAQEPKDVLIKMAEGVLRK